MSKIKDELKFDGKDTYFNRFLKRSSDEDIINYINNATKENINIFLEYEDENEYLCMYPLYFNFIINCIKKDKKDILTAIENNGFNAFSSSNQDKNNGNFYTYLLKRKMQPAILKMSSTFYDYLIKHLENKLTNENIDDIVSTIKDIEIYFFKQGKDKNFLNLLTEKDFYKIPQIKESIVFNPILIRNFTPKEIKLILDEKDLHNNKTINKNLFIFFKHYFGNIEKAVNILFKNNQDFLDKIISPYFSEISYDHVGRFLIELPDNEGLHINNKNTEKSQLIKSLSLYSDKNYKKLKNLGVNINSKDIFYPLFEYNNDISAIFYPDDLEKQADLKYNFFQNLINDIENLKYRDMLKVETIMNNTNFTMLNEEHFSVLSKLLIEKRQKIKKMSFADINNRHEFYHAEECVKLIFIGLCNQLKDKKIVENVLFENNSIPHVFENYFGWFEFSNELLNNIKEEYFYSMENNLYSFHGPLYKKNLANVFNFELYENNDLNKLRLVIFPIYNKILLWDKDEKKYLNEESENKFLRFIIKNKYEEILIDYMEKENQNMNQNAVEVEKRLLQIHMGNNKLEPASKKRL